MRRLSQFLAALSFVSLLSGGAGALPGSAPSWRQRLAEVPDPESSVSVGSTTRGRLLNGRLLEESATLRYRSGSAALRWGTDELVGALERAAERVARRRPGAKLTVGDLSLSRGGRFRPHRSHRSGRDVDLAFYLQDEDRAPVYPQRFERIRADGTPRRDGEAFRFDDKRNWELVASLLTDPAIQVQHAFVSRGLERRLLAEGRRVGAAPDLVERARIVLSEPRRGGRHNDHFHVRIYCDPGDRPACRDRPPIHDWLVEPTPALHAALRVPGA